jgi:hypothetical protein
MTTNTNSYFNTDVDALGRHLEKIRAFASESLEAAALRRDAVLAEVRQEEQRLAGLAAERRATEKALAEMHEQINRLSRDLEMLSANLGMLPPSAHQPLPAINGSAQPVMPPMPPQSVQAPSAM